MSDRKHEDAAQIQNTEQQKNSRLNAQLRQQFAEYDMLMESTGVCIVKAGMADGFPVEWCNEAAYRAIGYSREEYEAQFGYDIRSYFRGREEVYDALREAAEAALRGGAPRFQTLVRIPSRTGAFWAQCSGTFTEPDPETGKPRCLYGVFTDVSAVVETREKLDAAGRENARLAGIIDNIPAGVSVCTIVDCQPTHITINRHLATELGIPGGPYEIRSPEQLLSYIHVADRAACEEAAAAFLAGGTKLDMDCRLRRKHSPDFYWAHIEGRIAEQTGSSKTAYLTYTDVSALKETEKALREAVVSAKLIVWEYDIPGHTIYMADNETTNEECTRFGYPRVIPHVPEALAEFVDDKSLPALYEMYRKVESGENASCEVWYKRKPGQEPRCERVSYTVELDEAGHACRAYAVGVNITAEKNLEERYVREQSYLRDNRDFNLISKGHYNLTQNRVLEYTLQADKTPGGNYFDADPDRSYDEAAAALLQMPCPEEDRPALLAAVDRQSLLQRYQEGHLTTRAQYRRLQKGDLPLWMRVEMRTFASPLTGEVECFSYTYDITDKVRSELIMSRIAATEFDYVGLLFAKTRQFEFLQKSPKILFPDVHVRTDYAVCCDYVCEHFVSETEGAQFLAAVALEGILGGLAATGRWSTTYRRTENGRTLCVQLDYSWLNEAEQIILVVRTDVTAAYERDQKQLTQMKAAKLEADRANEAKSAFLSSMSHDMRTPLNAVLNFTDLALREEDAAVKQDYMEKVRLSGGLLLDLVNDTLELSRIESGKLSLEPEAVDGREIWASLIASLRPAAEARQIRLIEESPDDLSETLWVDRLKLQKIILNLLSNAIKYTPPGGTVRISVVRLDPQKENGCTRRITVEDNGIGISPEFLPRVFEPFSQEHRAEAGKVSGTGLGLSIVKRIVDLMGGTISVQSKLHCGTRFVVDLPITAAEKGQAREETAETPAVSLAGRRVLLCEDNDLNAEIVSILLREKSVSVDRAENGEAGLRLFADSMPDYYDAVLMDIRMPVLDGYGATRAIRALPRPDAQTVPILAMTADAFEEDSRHALETGMNGYLAKPIDPEHLCRALSGAVGDRSKE